MAKREGQPDPAADEVAEDTLERYQFPVTLEWGDFSFRAMTVRDMIRLRPKIREQWGDPLPDSRTPDGVADLNSVEYALAAGIAEMEIAALAVPQGWVWRELRNPDRLFELWVGYQKARDTFREGLGGF